MIDSVFDRVVIATPDGERELSAEQFRALSLWDRARLVLEGCCQFYRADHPVEVEEALDALRRAATSPRTPSGS